MTVKNLKEILAKCADSDEVLIGKYRDTKNCPQSDYTWWDIEGAYLGFVENFSVETTPRPVILLRGKVAGG